MNAPDRSPRGLSDLTVGQRTQVEFRVDENDMLRFAELSGDRSAIHVDEDYAKRAGFAGRVVYGGLIGAALSRLVGMQLPGPIGVATGWKIDFHSPLYLGELAVMSAELTSLSEAAGLAKLKYTVLVGERLIAKGTAEAKIVV